MGGAAPCPGCGRLAGRLARGPRRRHGPLQPSPQAARRLRDIDRAATLRGYCLARLEEHFGPLTSANRLPQSRLPPQRLGPSYCVEHLIAERFGRHLAKLDLRP